MANFYIPLVASPPIGESGGGGGSDLPAVTAEDNGDVLTVVNGQWDKAAPSGGGAFYVTFFYDGELPLQPSEEHPLTMDRTFSEIKAAYDAGMTIIGTGDLDGELSLFPPMIAQYSPAVDDDPDGFEFISPLIIHGTGSGTGGNYCLVQYVTIWLTADVISGSGEECKLATL